jgi:hypothetical protein
VLTTFWAGLGSRLAERWAAVGLSPPFAFWAGGLLAWVWGHGRGQAWGELERWGTGRSVPVQAAVVVGALVAVFASGAMVKQLTFPVLRVLEGYWPRWLGRARTALLRLRTSRQRHDNERFQRLADKVEAGTAAPDERLAFVVLDSKLRAVPTRHEDLMPTRLGNILRAAESWPGDKYGLDAVKCWPRLWLVLPEATRKELIEARAALDSAASAVLWGALFVIWAAWAWWALPVGLAVALTAYFSPLLASAQTYGTLLESAYDLHRPLLYTALRWPPPRDPAQEREMGRALTEYLWRGSEDTEPKFVGGDPK